MIRVVIADDHAIVRSGLRDLVSTAPDMQVVGEAADGGQAVELAAQAHPDVVILDLMMPGSSSTETLAHLRAGMYAPGVLVLSGHAPEHHAPAAMRQGASGFLSKTCEPAEILLAIRAVASGQSYVPALIAPLLAPLGSDRSMTAPHEMLSRREREVFLRLAQGETNPQVADALGVSVKTVATFRVRLVRKLHLASNSDLTYYALAHNLIA